MHALNVQLGASSARGPLHRVERHFRVPEACVSRQILQGPLRKSRQFLKPKPSTFLWEKGAPKRSFRYAQPFCFAPLTRIVSDMSCNLPSVHLIELFAPPTSPPRPYPHPFVSLIQPTSHKSLPHPKNRCGHCKSLKPAWDKLGDEFKGSKTILIGDVDCTKDDNKDLCQKYGVSGYPTLKYFTGATSAQGDAYNGGRDFDALSAWAKENLGPSCGAENIDLCDAEQKKSIEEKQALSPADLDKEIDTLEAELKASDEELEELLKSLQANYEAGKKKKDDTIAALSPKLSLLRSIKRAKGGDDAKEL